MYSIARDTESVDNDDDDEGEHDEDFTIPEKQHSICGHRRFFTNVRVMVSFLVIIGAIAVAITVVFHPNRRSHSNNSDNNDDGGEDLWMLDTTIQQDTLKPTTMTPSTSMTHPPSAISPIFINTPHPTTPLKEVITDLTTPIPIPVSFDDEEEDEEEAYLFVPYLTLQREGFDRAYVDFSPDGKRCAVGWNNSTYTNSHNNDVDDDGSSLLTIYEYKAYDWIMIASLPIPNIGLRGLKMKTSASIWIAGVYGTNAMHEVYLDGDENDDEEDFLWSRRTVDIPRGILASFDVSKTPNETVLILGYPYTESFKPGRVEMMTLPNSVPQGNISSATADFDSTVLYVGEYYFTKMGSSVALSSSSSSSHNNNNHLAIVGCASTVDYAGGIPPQGAGMLQLVDYDTGAIISNTTYIQAESYCVNVKVDMKNDIIAIALWTFESLEVQVFKVNSYEDNSKGLVSIEPFGNRIVIKQPQLDQKSFHAIVDYDDNDDKPTNRLVIGGPGVTLRDSFGNPSQSPGCVFVYELQNGTSSSTGGDWVRMGTAHLGVIDDFYGQDIAIVNDYLAVSSFEDDVATLRLYGIVY